MAKRSNKEKKPAKQLDLPPAPAPPPTTKVLPMRLQIGDRFSTESGEREVVGRPVYVCWRQNGSRASPGNVRHSAVTLTRLPRGVCARCGEDRHVAEDG